MFLNLLIFLYLLTLVSGWSNFRQGQFRQVVYNKPHDLEKWNPSDNQPNFLNVGTGLDITIKNLAELIAEVLDYKGEIKWDTSFPDGTPKKQLDVSKINNLGWNYKIKLREGIIDTIKQYEYFLNKNMIRN